MMTKKLVFGAGLAAMAFLGFSNAHAASVTRGDLSIQVEPIVGYERVQKIVPTAHSKDRLFYGARATGGTPYLSLEAEYIRGTDSETFPLDGINTTDTDDRVKLGLRSSYALDKLISAYARAGGQARRNTHEETSGGATTRTVKDWEYDPYAGLGLTGGLGHNLSIDGGLTVVFNQFPDMNKNEYQASLGFSVHFP